MVSMRPVVWLSVAVVLLLVGCGPSSGEIRQAREARYDAEPSVVFKEVLAGVQRVQKIEGYDAAAGMIRTVARWYEPDGTYANRGGDDEAFITDGSVLLAILVEIKGEPGAWYVEVTPLAVQHQGGSPQPRELKPGDPQMPGWVQGKLDNVVMAVHARLKPYMVAPEPAAAPAP